jgi:chaperonin GroEL
VLRAPSITVKGENADQEAGINIVRRALQAPAARSPTTPVMKASIVVSARSSTRRGRSYGFNAQTGEYGDMITMGIVDPVKVVRTALQDAASIAGLLITTEAMIAELPKKEAAPAAACLTWAAWAAWAA